MNDIQDTELLTNQNKKSTSNSNRLETRRSTRNHVFNIVFQLQFNNLKADTLNTDDLNDDNNQSSIVAQEILADYYNLIKYEEIFERSLDEDFKIFKMNTDLIENQYLGLLRELDKIDDIIKEKATGWEISRIDKVDLAILRLAIYEILFDDDVPKVVAINEAIELAKEYSSEKAHKFINAVLAKLDSKLDNN